MNLSWITNFFKRLIRKKSFWIILVIFGIIVGAVLYFNQKPKIQYVTEKVQRGDLTQTVSETGTVESAQAIDLNFKASGTLTELKVKEGDTVKTGDLLARLDVGSLNIQVRQAQANLNSAWARLNSLIVGASSQDIQVSQENVDNAKIAADNAQRNYDTTITKIDADINIYQQNVQTAQTNLTNTQSTYNNSTANSRQNLITALRNSIYAANISLDMIDYQNTDLGQTLDTASRTNAMNYYFLALTDKTTVDNILKKSDVDLTDADVKTASDSSLVMLDKINTSLNYLYNAVTSVMLGNAYSQTALATNRAAIKAEQANNSANLSGLQSVVQAYQTAQLNAASAIDTATSNLTSAQNTLNSTLANKQVLISQAKASLDSALGSYNLAKAQLALKIAKPRYVDIAAAQAQVDQSKAALDLANNNLNDYSIFAPVDGVITFVNYKVGEQVSSLGAASAGGTLKPAISMLGQGQFQIKVDVPESDIVKIKTGDTVQITLDAFGTDVNFTGQVTYIDIAETVIQDVVYYQVTVAINPSDQPVKSGMTANVNIMTASAQNVLSVASRAVKETDSGQKYVQILKNGQPQNVNVTTGLKADQGRIEITSGLADGQDVIVFQK